MYLVFAVFISASASKNCKEILYQYATVVVTNKTISNTLCFEKRYTFWLNYNKHFDLQRDFLKNGRSLSLEMLYRPSQK